MKKVQINIIETDDQLHSVLSSINFYSNRWLNPRIEIIGSLNGEIIARAFYTDNDAKKIDPLKNKGNEDENTRD